ncbi:MAG TPA: NUDIX hydrolase [Marmoricola sp.]|nr:NUDIX hydrolase [Marmoricola sp.]
MNRAAGDKRGDVVAAGAVVVHKGQVLLVHRPKYDDWSFPKGKQDPGEHVTATAVREVSEETGVHVRLGRPLPPQFYRLASGRTKTVHYWVGRVRGDADVSSYAANDEIDEVAWVDRARADTRLTYSEDRATLRLLDERPTKTHALVVLRHAQARSRGTWTGPDGARPLTGRGAEQAQLLVPLLAAYGVRRLVSSDSVRCTGTLEPYAAVVGAPVEEYVGLNEEQHTETSVAGVVGRLVDMGRSSALCTHRPVLPLALAHLGVEEEPLAKGECVVVHHHDGRVVATERHLVR